MSAYDIPAGSSAPAGVQTARFMAKRHRFIGHLRDRFGDVFTLRVLPGPRSLVALGDPALVKEVFAADPDQFYAGQANLVLSTAMGMHSVLLLDGDQHRRVRRLLMPAFSGAALRGYEPMIEAISQRMVDALSDGQRIETLDVMNALTLDVILEVVFGVTDEQRLAELRPRVTRMVDIEAYMLLATAFPRLHRIPPWKGYIDNLRATDALLYREIADRRRAHDVAERSDVLSRLLSVPDDPEHGPLTDEELRDQLVTLLLAGHETTATALSWTLHELARHPDVLARACRAADEGDDEFLEACFKEGMRLHPVIEFVGRILQSDQHVGGRLLPRGTVVAPSMLLTHSREATHPEHEQFDPDRFLSGRIGPHEWFPFGGGVRRCIGASFSLMEGTIVLRQMLQRFTVSTSTTSRAKIRNITSVPHDKAPITLTAR